MIEFNFDEIVAKIPQVEEYKRNHYYDSDILHKEFYGKLAEQKAYIYVEDWEGRKGLVTAQDLMHRAALGQKQGEYIIERLEATGRLTGAAMEALPKYFKIVKFDFEVKKNDNI